jgi:hypothetical protein
MNAASVTLVMTKPAAESVTIDVAAQGLRRRHVMGAAERMKR